MVVAGLVVVVVVVVVGGRSSVTLEKGSLLRA